MSNSISWVGNKVLDPGTPRQTAQPAAPMTPQRDSVLSPTVPTQRDSILSPTAPTQRDSVASPPAQRTREGSVNFETVQGPPPSTERGFIPYYLASNIGKYVRAEFIIGTTQYVDKTGRIAEVGINYFVLEDVNAGTRVMCDLYSVKFVTILPPSLA